MFQKRGEKTAGLDVNKRQYPPGRPNGGLACFRDRSGPARARSMVTGIYSSPRSSSIRCRSQCKGSATDESWPPSQRRRRGRPERYEAPPGNPQRASAA